MSVRPAGVFRMGLLLAGVALLSLACSSQGAESKIAAEVAKAERILIISSENDVSVPGGEQFLVDIEGVLRGTGKKGTQARITNSGDAKNHPTFKAGQKYVLLLKKNPEGRGWINLGTAVLPVKDGKVQYVVDGKTLEAVTLDELEELIAKGAEAAAPPVSARETLEGKWIVVLSQQGVDFYVWLMDFTKSGDGYKAKLLSTSKVMSASTLKSAEVSESSVHLAFETADGKMDVQGRFEKGAIRGNIAVGEGAVVPARLVPTDVNDMRKYDEGLEAKGRDAFIEAAGDDEPFTAFRRFVRKYPDSPLALEAYRGLIQQSKEAGYDEAKFQKLADEYLQTAKGWGERLELRANVDVGVLLSKHDFLPEISMKYLKQAESRFTDAVPDMWKQWVQLESGKQLIRTGKTGEGVALLKKLREKLPFDPEVTLVLAEQAVKSKKTEEALALYGELAALPMMEQMTAELMSQASGKKIDRDSLPSRVVRKLWTEKNGSEKGLTDYLNELYEKRLRVVAEKRQPQRKSGEGSRVVLCELFTGAHCPPCVAADVATGALEATYAQSEVIVLRYHQNIPGPDPLANEDSTERYNNYPSEGTPSLYVNGKPFVGPGGFLGEVSGVYQRLRETIAPFLTEKIDLRIELSAKAENGKVTISAKATGLKNFPDEARLKIVVAEDKIPFVAENGIRFHEMVVRAMPAGVEGVEPVKGQLAFKGDVDVAKLRSKLAREMAKTEAELTVNFEEKPLDLKALHVVAFLQEGEDGEVLQAIAVPVTGTLRTAERTASPTK